MVEFLLLGSAENKFSKAFEFTLKMYFQLERVEFKGLLYYGCFIWKSFVEENIQHWQKVDWCESLFLGFLRGL